MSYKLTFDFNPIAIALGPISITWYALMYLMAFVCILFIGTYRTKARDTNWETEKFKDAAFYMFIGAVLGGRIGYILFYNLKYYLNNPLSIIGFESGRFIGWSGMSFHGGLLGVLLATFLVAKYQQKKFWEITDFIAPLVPIGLFFGRIGNFINGELWGKATNQNWGFIFRDAPNDLYRHPSQLYEAGLEGIMLFIILWIYSQKNRPLCATSGVFLLGYGAFRFFVEFYREPDAHIHYLFGNWFTMGMLLCLPMIVFGLGLIIYAYKVKRDEAIS